jgi:hypothetical protein
VIVAAVPEILARLREADCIVTAGAGRLVVDRPDPATPAADEALASLRAQREAVLQALTDVWTFTGRWCCRSPRVWVEADRLHDAYVAAGGRLDRGTFLAALLADGRAWLGPAGLVVAVGLRADWPLEDGGTLRRRERGGRRAG